MPTSDTVQHTLTIKDLGDRWRRECVPCGFETFAWEKRYRPIPATVEPTECPNDPTVRALSTLQFSWGGLFNSKPADNYAVHLVRRTNRGTPGPSLCGIDRMDPKGPGFSVGGGISGKGVVHRPCSGCVATATTEFPGLPVTGSIGAAEIREALEQALMDNRPYPPTSEAGEATR